MHKSAFLGAILVLFMSCNQKNQEAGEEDTAFEFSVENWTKKSTVNAASSKIIKDWPEYMAMDASFDGLYTVTNTEDLRLIVEDLIENQKLLAEAPYPEAFDKPHIKSRQKVFHTFVLKTKGSIEYRLNPEKAIMEMINAYNSMRRQFDVITNNTLDLDALLDEN